MSSCVQVICTSFVIILSCCSLAAWWNVTFICSLFFQDNIQKITFCVPLEKNILSELSLMSSNNPFFFCMASTTNNHYSVRESGVCVCAHVCENDVSERERKKSLFISVMKRVSMGLKWEMRRGEEGDREREGMTEGEIEDYLNPSPWAIVSAAEEERGGSRDPGREEMEEGILSCDSSLYWVN